MNSNTTETNPIALMAPMLTVEGQAILVGRTTEAIPADALIAIATGSDHRRWLMQVVEDGFAHEAIRDLPSDSSADQLTDTPNQELP